MTLFIALVSAFLLMSLGAPANRVGDDVVVDAESCISRNIDARADLRLECYLRVQSLACGGDVAASAALAAAMQDEQLFRFQRGMSRFRARTGDERQFCELSIESKRAVLREALAPWRTRSESGKDWLMMRLGSVSGELDPQALANALETRRQLTISTFEKRAGLPVTPSGWTNLTGFPQSSGRINHLLIHPSSTNTMWLGSDGGGIWKTTDGGATWSAVNDFLGSLSIANLVMSPNNSNVLFAATNPRGSHTYYPFGILKSTDGGATWSQLAQTNPASNSDWTYVNQLAVHPGDGNTLLAATEGGAYLTSDGGTSWTKVAGISLRATYTAFHPANGNIRAIAYDNGTLRYTTTGDLEGAGALTSTVLVSGRYMKFAYAKSDPNRLYALVSDSLNGNTKLYKSVSGGAGWADLTSALSTLPNPGYSGAPRAFFYNHAYLSYTGNLWVDPLNAERVAIAEGWATFTPNASSPLIQRYDLCGGWTDFHAVVAHPGYNGTTNKIVFFMDDGGLYRVNDVDQLNDANGNCVPNVFAHVSAGATVTQVYSVSGRGGNPILGAQDVSPRAYRTEPSIGDATNKWRFIGNPTLCSTCSWIGDGMTTAASRASPSVLYGSRQYLDVFRSSDGGFTANSIVRGSSITEGMGATTVNSNAAFNAPFVLDPSSQSRMYAGGFSLWRSTNVDVGNPPTWLSIRAPFAEPLCGGGVVPIDTIAVAPSDPNVVWIAYTCAGRVFKTANALADSPIWTEVTTLPTGANQRSKASILFDRADPNIVWIGLGGYYANTLFKTTDGGATTGNWSPVAGLPSAPVNALLQHPAQADFLYAGTGVGLFASADGGATWSTTNEGPANVVVTSLGWYSESGATAVILVGTFGRGVFRANVLATGLIAPTAPTIGQATGGNATIRVEFTPGALGSGTLINYIADCGGITRAGGTSPITVGGLINGVAYTCRVNTTTTVGVSAWSGNSNAVTPSATPSPPVLIGGSSRKVHAAVGTFDLPLSLVPTAPTIEPRQGPAAAIVMRFDKVVLGATASVSEGSATISTTTFSGSDVTVGLTDISDGQYVTIKLTNVASSDGGTGGTGLVRTGFLLGDVNQNGVVSLSDLLLEKAVVNQPVTAANYLQDVNASGTLNLSDMFLLNGNLTRRLPAP